MQICIISVIVMAKYQISLKTYILELRGNSISYKMSSTVKILINNWMAFYKKKIIRIIIGIIQHFLAKKYWLNVFLNHLYIPNLILIIYHIFKPLPIPKYKHNTNASRNRWYLIYVWGEAINFNQHYIHIIPILLNKMNVPCLIDGVDR